jgi:hypothetical protein
MTDRVREPSDSTVSTSTWSSQSSIGSSATPTTQQPPHSVEAAIGRISLPSWGSTSTSCVENAAPPARYTLSRKTVSAFTLHCRVPAEATCPAQLFAVDGTSSVQPFAFHERLTAPPMQTLWELTKSWVASGRADSAVDTGTRGRTERGPRPLRASHAAQPRRLASFASQPNDSTT